MYKQYKPEWYTFELLLMTREAALVCLPIIFTSPSYSSALRQVRGCPIY